jgi:hypothetical protein
MKIEECKKRHINNIGFIDPDKVHHETVRDKIEETGGILLIFLTEQHFGDSILFPYNYK